ncbi:MAG: DUF481 domain-containing protein [Desulfobacterium sp.]|nr:DUF481 domain-containing protein [Desulfobacteraceae bacterium]MBA3037864.1 DUF481 domain-containing protein [Desulfobacterium sp.]MBU3949409.1 DUF481 domain-containing protein [Pseudomonadota bacterium]MBU4009673.1 DUF481 domain-containing protein [Pseudomonadota bacterium]MBU4036708.1 DUF481 domain-containing protein [Pseudomonadota bacterium]
MKFIFSVISVYFLLASAVAGHASEIILKNGDRISGTIIRKDGESIIIKTSYSAEIIINWGDVSTLNSDVYMNIVLTDGTSINGNAIEDQPGKIKIKSGEILETSPINLSQVVAINPPTKDASPVKLSGHANAGLSITNGNTDTKNTHVDIESLARTSSNRYTIGGTYNNAENDGVESANNLTGYMKYDYFILPQWYSSANSIFIKDSYKDLNLKTAIGLGAGYQAWESLERNLSLELGLNYVNEDYILAEDKQYPAARWALNFDQILFRKTVVFFHKQEILMGLEQVDDVSVLSQTGLRFPLIEKLNATLQVNWDWDNAPAPNTKSVDTNYLATLGYSW